MASHGLTPPPKEDSSGLVLLSRWRVAPEQQHPPSVKFPRAAHRSRHDAADEPDLPAQISLRHATRDSLVSEFIADQLPEGVVDRTQPAVKQRNWLLQVLSLPTLEPALEQALLAASMAAMGRRHGQQALLYQSLEVYTSCLSELRRAVPRTDAVGSDQALAACMVLAMYEFNECPGKAVSGYVCHYGGAMKLLQLRGPDIPPSGLAFSVFHALRIHSVGAPHRLLLSPVYAHHTSDILRHLPRHPDAHGESRLGPGKASESS